MVYTQAQQTASLCILFTFSIASDLLLRCRASSLLGVDDERDELCRSLIGPICPSESGRLLRSTLSNSEGPVGWNPLDIAQVYKNNIEIKRCIMCMVITSINNLFRLLELPLESPQTEFSTPFHQL